MVGFVAVCVFKSYLELRALCVCVCVCVSLSLPLWFYLSVCVEREIERVQRPKRYLI